MVSKLDSKSSGPDSSPGQGDCTGFMGKTLNSHSTSPHPGVLMGTGEYNTAGKPCNGLASHPGGVEILLVASCYRNCNKLRDQWPDPDLNFLPQV